MGRSKKDKATDNLDGKVKSVPKRPGKAKKLAQDITQSTSQKITDIGSQIEGSKAKQTLDSAIDKAGEGFDVVSGKKMLDLVQEKLGKQDVYNDILATKLNEVLERVAALEEQIKELKKK